MTTITRLSSLEARASAALAAADAPPLNPVELAEAAGLDPDPWQRNALTSTASRLLFNCSRQSGKSTVSAVLAVHTALTTPGALVLLLSPTLRQSGELFKKCLQVYRSAGRPVSPESETALSLTLDTGSRIVSLPGREGTVRGYSGVSLLIIDEAARVPLDLYVSARPMLAVSGGRLLALSTPFGNRGWWYEAWRSDEPWQRFEVPATMCPRIPASFLEEERRSMGEWWYRQEYQCEFMDAQSQAFTRADVERAFAEEVEAWDLSRLA
ncbi:MAG: terminase family protein [Dehalococcoidia bacterium]